jgi:hypothetical protein
MSEGPRRSMSLSGLSRGGPDRRKRPLSEAIHQSANETGKTTMDKMGVDPRAGLDSISDHLGRCQGSPDHSNTWDHKMCLHVCKDKSGLQRESGGK